MTNMQYFNAALQGDPKDVHGYERTLDQFLIRMAALKGNVYFSFIDYRGGKVLVADTMVGQYWFTFDQNDNLGIDQVL